MALSNPLLRWLLMGLAASASFYIGAQWLAPQDTADTLALAQPLRFACCWSARA